MTAMNGVVRRVKSTTIEFADGSVVPYRLKPTVSNCMGVPDGGDLSDLSGRYVDIGVDPKAGDLKTIVQLLA